MTTKTQAEDPKVEAEDTEDAEDEHGGGLTLEALDAKIDMLTEKITRALRGGTGPRRSAQDGNPDVAAQVRDEVTKIAASEGRRKDREDRIGQLEAKIEKLAEKPPREYRPITKLLWGDDTDG